MLLSPLVGGAARNPCRMREFDKEPTSERPTASVDQVWRLSALMPRRFRALVIFAAFTSLRWGELVALRVRDVDLDTGVVHVVRSSLNCKTANGFRAGRSQMPVPHSGHTLRAGGSGIRASSRVPAERSGGPDFQGADGGGVTTKQLASISALGPNAWPRPDCLRASSDRLID
jgi:integrase